MMRIIFMVVAVAGSTVAGLPAQSEDQLHRSKNSPTDTAPVSSVETDPRLHEDKNSPNVTTPLSISCGYLPLLEQCSLTL